ncbi:hypothetical protein DL771_010908 [Monosporascus sp. 5C6A]|nr:hypothetical protein DL771_010908 [Monosporascus sp. 5C6A]
MSRYVYDFGVRLIICKKCRFACVAGEVESHLDGGADHATRSAGKRRAITQKVQQIPEILVNQAQLGVSFQFSDPACAAVPFLQRPADDGLGCRRYPYISRALQKIQKHCRTAHGWVNPLAKGRWRREGQGKKAAAADLPWREGVRYQKFFRARAASGWFEESMLATYGGNLAADEEGRRRTADGAGGVNVELTWVKEMGWAKYFEGKDLVELYEAGAGPVSGAARARLRDATAREEQQRLARLGGSFDREMAKCAKRFEAVPYETLRWLASIDPNKPAGRPFGTKDHASSMDRYRAYWTRYLCYCVRAWRLGRDGAGVRYGVRFSDAQWAALDDVARLLDGDGDGDGGGDPDEGPDENLGGGLGGGLTGAGNASTEEALDRSVFQFWIDGARRS